MDTFPGSGQGQGAIQEVGTILFHEVEDYVFIMDESGTILEANKTALNKLGYTASELINRDALLLCPPNRRQEAMKIIPEVLAGKLPDFFPILYTKSGRSIPVKTRLFPGLWQGKKVLCVINKDISEISYANEIFKRSFHGNSTLMAILSNETGEFVEVNDAFIQALGFERKELIGHYPKELKIISEGPEIRRIRQEIVALQCAHNHEIQFRDKRGEHHVGLVSANFIDGDHHKYLLVSIHDITEKRQIENEVRTSKAQLQAILDNLPFMAWLKDETGRFIAVNKSFEETCGRTREEILGRTIFEIWPAEDAIAYHQDDLETIANHTHLLKETRRDGPLGEVWFETFKTAVFDQAGKVVGTTGTSRDITARKSLELKLEEQQRFLKAQKEFAEMLLRTVPSAVFSLDREQKVSSWNRMAESISGYSAAEMLDRECELFPLEPSGQWEDIEQPILDQKCILRTKQGEIRYLSKNVDVLRSDAGEIIGRIECFDDVTERALIAEKLRESEERYAAIINNAPEIVVIHRDGLIQFINRAGLAALGYPEEEVIGKHINDFLSESCQAQLRVARELRYKGEPVGDYEIAFPLKNGQIINVIVRGTIITYEKEPAILAVLIDITDRKRAEEALTKKDRILAAVTLSIKELLDNRNYYHAVAKCFDILGSATQVDRVYLFQNHYDENGGATMSQIFEWNSGVAEPQINNPLLQELPFRQMESFITPLKKGQAYHGIVRELPRDYNRELLEAQKILSIIVLPVMVGQRFWGFVGFDECKFEREWTEAEFSLLSVFASSLGKAIERTLIEEELELARQAAETANISKSRFLANMSHEIRTPMNGILGFLDILGQTKLATEQQDYLREAKTASEALLYLINDILDLSKIEAGKLSVENIGFMIRSTVEDAVSIHVPKAFEKQLELHTMIKANVPEELMGDPARLRQILHNLLSNAVKFTEKGEIDLIVECIEVKDGFACIRFEVRDTGIGIRETDLNKLFKPFVQVDPSMTRKYGGTGLGLAISNELAKMMNGELTVTSTPGQGSSFCMTAWFKILSFKNPKVFQFATLAKKNILIVDDHPGNRRVIKAYLEETGSRVKEAEAADQAIALLLTQAHAGPKIDIVLVDYQMPGMDGYEFATVLQSIPFLKDVKLILITSAAQKGDAVTAGAKGFDGYLAKPVKRDELLDCISIVLGLKQKPTEGTLPITRYVVHETKMALQPKILLAEDNEMNRKVVSTVLKKRGMTCDISENGQEVLAALQERDYDIILMDCQMPGIDGYEASARIREYEGCRKHTPIIAITADAMEGDKQKCLAAGMDDYLSKPLNFELMFQMIEKYTKSKGSSTPKSKNGFTQGIERMSSEAGLTRAETEELFSEYLQSLPKILAELAAALEAANFSVVKNWAHQIKGSSGNLQIAELMELAQEMERQAVAAHGDQCRALLQEMQKMLDLTEK